MNKILSLAFITIVGILTLLPSCVVAQESENITTAEKNVLSALSSETDAYNSYIDFVDRMEDLSAEEFVSEFTRLIPELRLNFNAATSIYNQYVNESSIDSELRKIVIIASDGNRKAREALGNYEEAFTGDKSDTLFALYVQYGDAAIKEGITKHEEATALYNDYTGASGQQDVLDLLYLFSTLSILISIVLFFKARTSSIYEADITRAAIYRNLLYSSLWMLGGLVITTVSLYDATQKGGTYYIFYGPVGIGFLGLAKGLWQYLRHDRSVLAGLKKESEKKILSDILNNMHQ